MYTLKCTLKHYANQYHNVRLVYYRQQVPLYWISQHLLLHSINHKYASSVFFHMVKVALPLIENMKFALMSTCDGQCSGWNATVKH